MGLLSHIVAYKLGRRAGRRGEARRATNVDRDDRDPDCINFDMFCKNYGSCDGMTCEFPEDAP